jgi:hypothetical protein
MDDGINIVTQLGTTYGVDRIFVEREKDGIFEIIGSIYPVANEVKFLDEHPKQGLNIHRIRIKLVNGQEIISEYAQNYFLTETPFMVFPNPVSSFDQLTILSKEFTNEDALFRLYNNEGKEMLTAQLVSSQEYISLSNLSYGLYLYVIQTSEGYFKGKLLIK